MINESTPGHPSPASISFDRLCALLYRFHIPVQELRGGPHAQLHDSTRVDAEARKPVDERRQDEEHVRERGVRRSG